MVFVTKSNFFIMYVFLANPARKIVFYLPHKNRMLYRPEKLSFQKVQKIRILQRGGGGSMFFVKKSNFWSCVFFWQINSENIVFWYSPVKKKAFWTRKLNFEKSPTNQTFWKGLVHSFCRKLDLFIIFVFWANQATKKSFLEILDKKECIWD